MLLQLIFINLIALSLSTLTEDQYRDEFLKLTAQIQEETGENPFASRNGKMVSTSTRYKIFKTRYNEILKVNAGGSKYVAVSNEFTLKTDEELQLYTGLNLTLRPMVAPFRRIYAGEEEIPEEQDWVEKGHVTEIKAQGVCGSCWAFAAVAALESHYAISGGKLKMMSEQQLVDCTYTSHPGCQGGWMGDAFDAIRQKLGNRLATAATYQYLEKEGKCNLNIWDKGDATNALVAANFQEVTYTSVPYDREQKSAPYEMNLARAVAIGPVTVAIEVTNPLYSYGSGVFDVEDCKNQVNHAVTVVGYDTETFLIRNSWGSTWGDGGYAKFDRSIKNQCLIGSWPEYPNLQLTGDQEGQGAVNQDPCEPNPCQNKGRCVDLGTGSFVCKCKKKFTGSQCQERKVKCTDKSNRCPRSKDHKLCQKKGEFVTARCQLSCGFCYL